MEERFYLKELYGKPNTDLLKIYGDYAQSCYPVLMGIAVPQRWKERRELVKRVFDIVGREPDEDTTINCYWGCLEPRIDELISEEWKQGCVETLTYARLSKWLHLRKEDHKRSLLLGISHYDIDSSIEMAQELLYLHKTFPEEQVLPSRTSFGKIVSEVRRLVERNGDWKVMSEDCGRTEWGSTQLKFGLIRKRDTMKERSVKQ